MSCESPQLADAEGSLQIREAIVEAQLLLLTPQLQGLLASSKHSASLVMPWLRSNDI